MAGIFNIAPNASNAAVKVTTATTVKTLAQIATPSTTGLTLLMWSVSFDGSAAGTPLICELVEVDVAATVTSFTPQKYGSPSGDASLCVGGASATGYNATAEGTIAAYRLLDYALVPPTSGYTNWFPLGWTPYVGVSKFLRLRVTGSSGVTPGAALNIIWQE